MEQRNVKQQFYSHNPLHITISSSDLRTPSKKLSSNRLGACFAVQVHFLISCMHGLAKPPALTPRRRHRAVAVQSPERRTVGARSPGRRRILLGVPRCAVHGDGVRCGLLRYSGGRQRRRRRGARGSMRRKKRGLSQTSQVS